MEGLRNATWRKSTKSGNTGNCLEACVTGSGGVLVRDTADRERGALAFPAKAWQGFTNSLKHPVRPVLQVGHLSAQMLSSCW
jgi:hypothetical protein